MRRALLAEYQRVASPPYETPLVVVLNGFLMAGAWVFFPPTLLFHLHEPRVFPLVLASWMYADVPATNVLGSDPERMAVLVGQPAALQRSLMAKSIVLWSLVTPICLVVTLVFGLATHQSPLSMLGTAIILVVMPFGGLGVASWLGILLPYHALPLALRWQHRRPYGRMVVRWLFLVLVPYAWVPMLSGLLLAPALLLWRASGVSWVSAPDGTFVLGALLLTVLSIVVWRGGVAVAVRLTTRRSQALREFLVDPLNG